MKRVQHWFGRPEVAFRLQVALGVWAAALGFVDIVGQPYGPDDLALLPVAAPILLIALALAARRGGPTLAEGAIIALYFMTIFALGAPVSDLGASLRGTGEQLDLGGYARSVIGVAVALLAAFATSYQLHSRVTGLGRTPPTQASDIR